MDSGDTVLLIVSIGVLSFLAFLTYNVMATKDKATFFVRNQAGDIVAIVEK